MAKYMLLVGSNCNDLTREKEFNDWYDNIHLPDILETPGFTGAARFENTAAGDGEARYLAAYHIETDDLDALMKVNAENIARKREAGRMTDLLTIVWRGMYRQTSSVSK